MKTVLTSAAIAATLMATAMPALALAVDPFPPALTFPEPKPAPTIALTCADLAPPQCPDARA